MEKLLEAMIDEKGDLHFSTEHPLNMNPDELMKHPEKLDAFFKTAIKSMVKCTWEEKNFDIYPIIRVLSMAEIMSSWQPYEQAEMFWSTMMFKFIPRNEKYANQLKKPFGANPEEIVRPKIFRSPDSPIETSIFPMRFLDDPDISIN